MTNKEQQTIDNLLQVVRDLKSENLKFRDGFFVKDEAHLLKVIEMIRKYQPEINIENKKTSGPFAPTFFDDGTPNHDTMGLIAMDANGDLSGAVTTSGMAFKVHGRVGDSPIIGAGLFVDNEIGAATSSGVGEEVIRICGTHLVVELMRQGLSPENACKKAVERIVKRDPIKAATLQVGFLAINKKGQHGAYAIQKGFVYSVKSNTENQIHTSKYLI